MFNNSLVQDIPLTQVEDYLKKEPSPNFRKRLSSSVNKEFEVLPGIFSIYNGQVVPKYIEFLNLMMSNLENKGLLEVSETDAHGALKYPYIDRSLKVLSTVPGLKMNPTSLQPIESVDVLERSYFEHSLKFDMMEHAWIELCKDYYSHHTEDSYYHMDGGTTSLGNFERTYSSKKKISDRILDMGPSYIDRLNKLSYKELRDSDMWFAYFILHRNQAEGSKERKSWIPKKDGSGMEQVVADKDVPGYKNFYTTRVRVVNAVGADINWAGSYIEKQFQTSFLNRYAYTYKLADAKDLSDSIKDKYPVGVDVSQFDQATMHLYPLVKLELQVMEAMVSASYSRYQKDISHCPGFAANPYHEKESMIAINHPNSREDTHKYYQGILSGINRNVPLGRKLGTHIMMIALNDCFPQYSLKNFTNYQSFLKGEMEFCYMMNSTDDCVFVFTREEDAELFKTWITNKGATFPVKLEIEHPLRYLSKVIIEQDGNYSGHLSVEGFLRNHLSPEKSFGTHKSFPFIGNAFRDDLYMKQGPPIIKDVYQILCTCIQQVYNTSRDELYSRNAAKDVRKQLENESIRHMISTLFTEAVSRFMLDPSSMYYNQGVMEEMHTNSLLMGVANDMLCVQGSDILKTHRHYFEKSEFTLLQELMFEANKQVEKRRNR